MLSPGLSVVVHVGDTAEATGTLKGRPGNTDDNIRYEIKDARTAVRLTFLARPNGSLVIQEGKKVKGKKKETL